MSVPVPQCRIFQAPRTTWVPGSLTRTSGDVRPALDDYPEWQVRAAPAQWRLDVSGLVSEKNPGPLRI